MSVNENRFNKLIREENDVKRLGIRVEYLCLSLMCNHHSNLHGSLISFDKAKETFNLDSAPDDCRCGISQILIDENGMPTSMSLIERVRSQVRS